VGAGGIGLNVIQGCAIAGAERIIAIDTSDASSSSPGVRATDLIKARPARISPSSSRS